MTFKKLIYPCVMKNKSRDIKIEPLLINCALCVYFLKILYIKLLRDVLKEVNSSINSLFLFTLQIYLRLQVSDSNKFFAFLSSSIKTLTFRVNLPLTRSHFYKMQILFFSTIILLKMTNCHWILYTVSS